MKRPKQHVTDSQAQLLFKQSLPPEWIVRPLEPDYALDYEVEIVEAASLTGLTFYVQLKGMQSPKYTGPSLSLSFARDKLIYYSEKVNRPVFIIVADLVSNACLWLYAQRFIREVLRDTNPRWYLQESVTLHIPKANKLPDTLNSLVQATKTGTREEFVQQFGRPTLRLALEIEDKLGDPKAIAEAIKQNEYESASVRFDLVDACFQTGDRDSC